MIELGLQAVVVGPVWPQATWWPMVAQKSYLDLGLVSNWVVPGDSGVAHPFGSTYEPKAAVVLFYHGACGSIRMM